MFKGHTANHCIGECGGILDTSLVSNSSNTSGSTVDSTLNFISPLQGSGGFYLYFGFFSTSPQDWVLDHHKVPLTTPNSYTTLQRSTDNFFLSCTVGWRSARTN